MDFEDKTVRELTEAAQRNAKAERADPNEPVRKQIVKDTTERIMVGLGLAEKEER
jgi:hypothetical protein